MSRNILKNLVVLIIMFIIMTSSKISAEIRYKLINLGQVPEFYYDLPRSINNRGQIVGCFPMPNCEAIIYDITGRGNHIKLGGLGGVYSEAYSINNYGQIVGCSDKGSDPNSYATIFDPSGQNNNIEISPQSVACTNNDMGQIAGFMFPNTDDYFLRRAILFKSACQGADIDLGTLPVLDSSDALSINNHGQIVGASFDSKQNPTKGRAVLFDSSGCGNNIDLGVIAGYKYSTAFSINDKSQIVGRANNDDDFAEYRTILFDPNLHGNNVDLGGLPGKDWSEAYSINNRGQIVGRTYDNFPPNYSATLFDITGQGNNIDLNQKTNAPLGWTLQMAWKINDNGWIIGDGIDPNGKLCSIVLIPITGGDFNNDGFVNFIDFSIFAAAWRSTMGDNNWNPSCDIYKMSENLSDGIINELDLSVFAGNWLTSQ
jgi:uncharacterized membrane protein